MLHFSCFCLFVCVCCIDRKWHLGFYKWPFTPTYRGFDSFYGYYQGSEDYYTHESSGAYDLHEENGFYCGKNCSRVVSEANGNYSAFLFTNRAIDIIKNHTKEQKRLQQLSPNTTGNSKPFFLYLPYQSVHSPREVPSYYSDKYKNSINNTERREFAGMVSCLDEGIGNVTKALKEAGVYNNTIIVFSSDNGAPVDDCGGPIGGSNIPHRGGKHSIWEGGTHVTGAIYIPPSLLKRGKDKKKGKGKGKTKGKRDKKDGGDQVTYDGLVHVVDWMPTLLNAAGIDSSKLNIEFDGINLWDTLLKRINGIKLTSNDTTRDEVYYGTNNPCDDVWIVNNTGIRIGDMKYLNISGGKPRGWYPPPGTNTNTKTNINMIGIDSDARNSVSDNNNTIYGQLYNLSSDGNESMDVSSMYPDIMQQLFTRLNQIQETGNPMAVTDENCTITNVSAILPTDPIVGLYWVPWCSPDEKKNSNTTKKA